MRKTVHSVRRACALCASCVHCAHDNDGAKLFVIPNNAGAGATPGAASATVC